jgi:hypothetical protein
VAGLRCSLSIYVYFVYNNIVTCRGLRVMIMTGYSSSDWIYWHFGYEFS